MDPWSNIDISDRDSEVIEINRFEDALGSIPASVRKIRELITRFEVCHFKYQQHIKYICSSIANLEPVTDPDKIGLNHISKGENAWENDRTGRSLVGQQYLWILKNWLAENTHNNITADYDKNLDLKISKWLGDKTPDKERIVRLLIARLTYDWESYEKLKQGDQFKDLEYQACRIDICHYAFPKHLNSYLRALGKMKPQEDLEGCGSYDSTIKPFIGKEFSELCDLILDMTEADESVLQNKNENMKVWLYACLAKTFKEQTHIVTPIPGLIHKK